eukprot:1136797-Pelagomonas_calceolata.AAC.10
MSWKCLTGYNHAMGVLTLKHCPQEHSQTKALSRDGPTSTSARSPRVLTRTLAKLCLQPLNCHEAVCETGGSLWWQSQSLRWQLVAIGDNYKHSGGGVCTRWLTSLAITESFGGLIMAQHALVSCCPVHA